MTRLRDSGAEVVIALAHSGIGTGQPDPDAENAALALASVPGIDAIVAGHSHEVFPDPATASNTEAPGVDHQRGTLHGRPAVMAGFRGSHLGVLDLCLGAAHHGRRAVLAARAEARPVKASEAAPAAPADPAIVRLVTPAHRQLERLTGHVLARTEVPLHTYRALARCDRLQRLVMAAKTRALTRALAGTAAQDLPVLASSAPFKTGGIGGPDFFTDLPPGPVTLRSVAALYPFPNTLIGLRLTGRDIADWLERAASGLCHLHPGRPDQPYWDSDFPGHSFHSLAGLTYRIDPCRPARYDAAGRCVNPAARRIVDLRHDGAPINPDASFAVAVNSFRAFGGGLYPVPDADRILFRGQTLLRDIIAEFIAEEGVTEIAAPATPWAFEPRPGVEAVLTTGPGLRAYPEDIARLNATDLGVDAQGFLRLRLRF